MRRLSLRLPRPRRRPLDGPLTLRRRGLYILPTAAGWLFALVLLAMLIGAINYNNSLAHALTFLLGSLALVAMVHTHRNLAGLTVEPLPPHPVFAGEAALFPLQLHNPGPGRFGLELGGGKAETVLAELPQRGETTLVLRRPAEHRGRQTLGNVVIATRFPVGLFRAWAPFVAAATCLVYPQPAGERPLPAPPVGGNAGGDRHRGEDDFAGLRPYRPGDSARHIHWKALAREQPLLTKQFGGGQAPKVVLAWSALAELEVEGRLSQLCRWVLEAEAGGLLYRLELPGTALGPGRGEAHLHACLEALALYGVKP